MSINMIGPEALKAATALGLRVPETAPEIPFSGKELEAKAEDYLLAHAPKVEIGEPKELVKERIIRLGA